MSSLERSARPAAAEPAVTKSDFSRSGMNRTRTVRLIELLQSSGCCPVFSPVGPATTGVDPEIERFAEAITRHPGSGRVARKNTALVHFWRSDVSEEASVIIGHHLDIFGAWAVAI